jgi:hypothetical protein
MRIKVSSEYLFAALGLAGAGMLEIVPDKHFFAWILIGLAVLILISGFRIDGWHIKFERPRGWRARVSAWGPWILIVGGPLLGLLWLYLGGRPSAERSNPSSGAVSELSDRWTWPALTASEIDDLFEKLRGKGQHSFHIACNRAECSALADSFDRLFKRLSWPSFIGDGGFFATGVAGILLNPGDDEGATLLKRAMETTTILRADLGPPRQAGVTYPTMLVLGTKPSVMASGPIRSDEKITIERLVSEAQFAKVAELEHFFGGKRPAAAI